LREDRWCYFAAPYSNDAINEAKANFNALSPEARTALCAISDRVVLKENGLRKAVTDRGQKLNDDIFPQLQAFILTDIAGNLRIHEEYSGVIKALCKP
jgi:hypothetical protein